jgi:putative sigma-54 modulation protein
MQITVKGRHWKPGPDFREYAEARIERLARFYPRLISAQLTVTREGYRHHAELRLQGNSLDLLAKSADPEASVALDQVLEKQERALKRRNERRKDKRKRGAAPRLEPAAVEAPPLPRTGRRSPEVVRERSRRPQLSAEQAVRALLRSNREVLVFLERGADEIRVAYRMKNGQVGLIEIE